MRRLQRVLAVTAVAVGVSSTTIAAAYVAPGALGGDLVDEVRTSHDATAPSLSQGPGAGPTRRLVWDEGRRRGIHLRTGRVSGDQVEDVRPVYDSDFGFTSELHLDSRGRRVAFSPCCRKYLPPLVVVDVSGRNVREVLGGLPQFYGVGGIAWAPDGTRLAFEGFLEIGGRPSRGLYTIGLDGRGLHVVLAPEPVGDDTPLLSSLGWTGAGILVADGGGEMSLVGSDGGGTTLLSSGVGSFELSGNGRWLFTTRTDAEGARSVWRSRPDGSGAVRVLTLPGSSAVPPVVGNEPDRRGRLFLGTSLRSGPPVLRTWRVGEPVSRARTLEGTTGAPSVASWY